MQGVNMKMRLYICWVDPIKKTTFLTRFFWGSRASESTARFQGPNCKMLEVGFEARLSRGFLLHRLCGEARPSILQGWYPEGPGLASHDQITES